MCVNPYNEPMKYILDYTHIEARKFFLKEESYFNFDLPHYFNFETLLSKVSAELEGKLLVDFLLIDPSTGKPKPPYPGHCEDVNYKLLNNKDGKFAWRPFQLIHPALYVSLVHCITEKKNWLLITERFKEFKANPNIHCCSIPIESESEVSDKAETVSKWWQEIEQRSIALALQYEYVLHTDISDCYGSIYTHSVPWALHTKAVSKADRGPGLVGNNIDRHLQDMSFGQTNGIPQGSVLMDFVAEMVLGYADLELTDKITKAGITDYQIIRYRDDYRIFSNNPQDIDHITKLLTETLIDLGMRLNAQKTMVSNNVVRDSIKADKLYWNTSKNGAKDLQQHLLLIHDLAEKFPNSGSLVKALTKFFERLQGVKEVTQNVDVYISIIVDIAYKNPRTYPIASAILSKLLSFIEKLVDQLQLLDVVTKRFDKIPNTGHIKIWLQRISLKIDRKRVYDEKLCLKVNDPTISLWNSDWLDGSMKKLITDEPVVDEKVIDALDVVIDFDEVSLFGDGYDD